MVFSGFPQHKEAYAIDVQNIMEESIEKYGSQEWRLNVLTCELHGHLGIYAIIGAKMGLYAREILGAGHDELVINSLAGSKPPVSCMNDGLQVSTGATLGHGLISLKEIDHPLPAAEFRYRDKFLKISLKDSLYSNIKAKIRETVESSGALTPVYWQKIRDLGLQIWLEYDRKEIFDIRE